MNVNSKGFEMFLEFVKMIAAEVFSSIAYIMYFILRIEDIQLLIILSFLVFSYICVSFFRIFFNIYTPAAVFFMTGMFGAYSNYYNFFYISSELNDGVFIDELMLMAELSSLTALGVVGAVFMVYAGLELLQRGSNKIFSR